MGGEGHGCRCHQRPHCLTTAANIEEGTEKHESLYPSLAHMVETFQKELAATGQNMDQIVSSSCQKLGVHEEGQTLIIKAQRCWDRIHGSPAMSSQVAVVVVGQAMGSKEDNALNVSVGVP